MLSRGQSQHLFRAKDLVVVEDVTRPVLGDAHRDPERMVWCGKPGFVLEPADEGLRVGDSGANVDRSREPLLVEPTTGLGIARDVHGTAFPGGCRGRVEA